LTDQEQSISTSELEESSQAALDRQKAKSAIQSLLNDELTVGSAVQIALLNNPSANPFEVQKAFYHCQAGLAQINLLRLFVDGMELGFEEAERQFKLGSLEVFAVEEKKNKWDQAMIELEKILLTHEAQRKELNCLLGLELEESDWSTSLAFSSIPKDEPSWQQVEIRCCRLEEKSVSLAHTVHKKILFVRSLLDSYDAQISSELKTISQNIRAYGGYHFLGKSIQEIKTWMNYQAVLRDYWIAHAELERMITGKIP